NLGVANLNAVRKIGAENGGNQIGSLNTAGKFCNACATKIGRIEVGVTTGTDIIPNGTWNED
ncbi:34539_t:CDS:1, partial [Racocetra persica]